MRNIAALICIYGLIALREEVLRLRRFPSRNLAPGLGLGFPGTKPRAAVVLAGISS